MTRRELSRSSGAQRSRGRLVRVRSSKSGWGGSLMPTTEDDTEGRARVAGFMNGLRDVGLSEGRSMKLDIRWGSSDVERLGAFASELVAFTPDVLLAGSTPRWSHWVGPQRRSPSCLCWSPILWVRASFKASHTSHIELSNEELDKITGGGGPPTSVVDYVHRGQGQGPRDIFGA